MNSFSYEIFLVRLNVIKMLYNGFHALIQISGFMLLFLDLCIYIYIYIYIYIKVLVEYHQKVDLFH